MTPPKTDEEGFCDRPLVAGRTKPVSFLNKCSSKVLSVLGDGSQTIQGVSTEPGRLVLRGLLPGALTAAE